jgi:hypothetical protein
VFSNLLPNTPKLEKPPVLLTPENITTFYQFIAESTSNAELSSDSVNKLQMLIKNYPIYLKQVFQKNSTSNQSLGKSLLFILTLLKKEEFLKNKFDSNLLEMIMKNITNNGQDLTSLDKETSNELLEKLKEIQDQAIYNAELSRRAEEKQFLEKTRFHSHLTIGEQLTVANSVSYSSQALSAQNTHHKLLEASSLNHEASKAYDEKNFQTAMIKHLSAWKIVNNIPKDLLTEWGKKSLIIYQISFARTAYAFGNSLHDKGRYTEAVEKYILAKNIYKYIPEDKLNDTEVKNCDIALANSKKLYAKLQYNEASELYSKKDFNNANMKFLLAWRIVNNIPKDLLTEQDKKTLIIYQISLARTNYAIGVELEGKDLYREALEKYIEAKDLYKDIPPDKLTATEVNNCDYSLLSVEKILQNNHPHQLTAPLVRKLG